MIEKIKAKSVLKEEELAYLLGVGFRDAANEEFFSEQKNLFLNEQVSKVWDAWYERNWLGVLEAILKIPADIDSDIDLRLLTTLDMVNLGRTSLLLLFWNIRRHFTIEEVRTVSQFSRRAGQDLNKEPWKEMFLEMARKYFPDDAEKMIETVAEAGIGKDEHIQVIWGCAVSMITAGAEDLAKKIGSHFIRDAVYIGESMNERLVWAGEKLLQAGDILLLQRNFVRACGMYKDLQKEHLADIGQRQEIIEIQKKYDEGNLTQGKRERQIKQVIKKAGLCDKNKII